MSKPVKVIHKYVILGDLDMDESKADLLIQVKSGDHFCNLVSFYHSIRKKETYEVIVTSPLRFISTLW